MELMSLLQLRIVEDMLCQIRESILQLEDWNGSYADIDELLSSPEGMKTLAADCMLLEAIGEGFKRVDERTSQQLLCYRPEIPWKAVKGMRDQIAHGYFNINSDIVWDVVTNDLPKLHNAVDYLIEHLYETMPFE